MTTNYKFLNDNYEKVENDMKASMYDIVMSEQEKTAAIIGKAQTTSNIKLQEKLIELCNEESECLHNLLELSNLFTENLHKLDSYSRALKKLEDKNIASIITGMRKQRAVDRGQSPVDTAEELEEINKKQEEISKEQEELQAKEIAAQKLIEQVEQEQKSNSEPVEQEEPPVEEEQVKTEEQISNDPIVKSVELVEDDSEEENNPDELAKTVGIDIKNGDLGSGVMTMESTSVQGEQSTEDKNNKGLELAKSLGINLPSNLGSGVITFNSSASLDENNNLVEDNKDEPKEEQQEEENSSTIIPQISTTNEESENQEVAQEDNSPVIPTITETPVVETEPPQEEKEEPKEETKTVIEEVPASLKVYKKDFDEVRAILTSASQIEKLRLSRFSQEALLNSKNFFANVTNDASVDNTSTGLVIPVVNNEQVEPVIPQAEPVIPQPEQVIPQVSNGELVIPTGTTTEQVIPTQPEQPNTLEQQLIDNNLLPNDINSLQAQIDQKMAEAKQLYDAGQTQEAQNMYNEISELSKSLQAQQAEQGPIMAA